jgi:dCTP diphosphatase
MSKRKHVETSTTTTSNSSSSSSSSTTATNTSAKSKPSIVIPDGTHTIRQEMFNNSSLESIRREVSNFAKLREWDQFHSPRNLVLAMMGEVGELAEIFQWKGDEKCNEGLKDWTDEKLIHLGEELSDILLYLVRLSDKCGIDLVAAAKRKLAINGLKYPAAAVKGKSGKYTEYKTQWRVEQASKKARKEKEEEK